MDVQDMSGSNSAFAVIKNDGTVLAWGDCAVGGDSRTLADVCPKIFSISISFFNTNNFAFFFLWGWGSKRIAAIDMNFKENIGNFGGISISWCSV